MYPMHCDERVITSDSLRVLYIPKNMQMSQDTYLHKGKFFRMMNVVLSITAVQQIGNENSIKPESSLDY